MFIIYTFIKGNMVIKTFGDTVKYKVHMLVLYYFYMKLHFNDRWKIQICTD